MSTRWIATAGLALAVGCLLLASGKAEAQYYGGRVTPYTNYGNPITTGAVPVVVTPTYTTPTYVVPTVPAVPAVTYPAYSYYGTNYYPTTVNAAVVPAPNYYSPSYYNVPSTGTTTTQDASRRPVYGALGNSADRTNALVDVRVPDPNAEVWFGNSRTAQRGTLRGFMSPLLEPGHNYAYIIKARWMEDGREVTRAKTVPVRSGSQVMVDFTVPDDRGAAVPDRAVTNPATPAGAPTATTPATR